MTWLIELTGGPADGMLIDLADLEGWPEVFSYLMPAVDHSDHEDESGTAPIYRFYEYRSSDRAGGRGRRLYQWDGRPPTPLTT